MKNMKKYWGKWIVAGGMAGLMVSSAQAAETPWVAGNRIAISADGNPDADKDDVGATPFTIAVVAKAGLQDQLVHYDFNNFLDYKAIAPADNRMWESAMGAVARFGLDQDRFFDAAAEPDAAVVHLTEEINKSTATDPLYVIIAGPMELIYRALEAADETTREHVVLVSHHNYNENITPRPWQRNLDDVEALVPNIGYLRITDQNGNASNPGLRANDNAEFDWMKDHADPNLQWVYERVIPGGYDVSDAGMLAWLIGISGTDEKVTVPEMGEWFGDSPVPVVGGSSTTPTAPAAVEPVVTPPITDHIFEEIDGRIVIEAESVPLTDDWVLKTGEEEFGLGEGDYSGEGYIRWEPSWLNEITHQHRGALCFKLRITNPGTYRMAMRSSHTGAPERDKWNDCWTVMGNNPMNPYGITRKTYHAISAEQFESGLKFNWSTTHNNYGTVANTDGEFSSPEYELSTGDHYFWVLGRSGGFRLDKIQFFKEGVSGFKEDSQEVTPMLPGVGVPTLSAGDEQTILMPASMATLSGTASDDDGVLISTVWTQKSGPNQAVIADPNSLITDITGTTLGTYVFTLTIEDDSGNVRAADVTINFVGSIVIHEDDFSDYDGVLKGDHWKSKWSKDTTQQNLAVVEDGVAQLLTTVAGENYHVSALDPFALEMDGQTAVIRSDFRYTHAAGMATEGLNRSAFALILSQTNNWWVTPRQLFSMCNRGTGIGALDRTDEVAITHEALGVDPTVGGVSDWFQMEFEIERGDVNYISTPRVKSVTGELLYEGAAMDLGVANGASLYAGYSTGGSGGNEYDVPVSTYSKMDLVEMDNYELIVASPNMTPIYEQKSASIGFSTDDGFVTGAASGQEGFVAASGWSVSTGDGCVGCSAANANITLTDGVTLLKAGDTLDFTVTCRVLGTHVPTGWKYMGRLGVTMDTSGKNQGYDTSGEALTHAMFTFQSHPSTTNSFRVFGDGWQGLGSSALASNPGDVFALHYSLELGDSAATTAFSLQLKNVTQGTSVATITDDDGIGDDLYNALKTGKAYVYFETGALGDGLTGIEIDQLDVSYPLLLVDSYPVWINGYAVPSTDADFDGDCDHDGVSNLQEYIAGTSPDDVASVFALGMLQQATDEGTELVLEWEAAPGRTYDILMTTDLTTGEFSVIQKGIVYPQNCYTVPVHQVELNGFYKAEVALP